MLKLVVISTLLLLSQATRQVPVPTFKLDQQAGVGGLIFGQAALSIPDFAGQFHKQGKPRLRTQLYKRLKDTTQLRGLGRPDSYWFRHGKFVAVDLIGFNKLAPQQALNLLAGRYGPPQADTVAGEFYWLGQHTFILLELPRHGGTTSVLMGSLAMLNELVVESAVRLQARRLLHWQPDSIGLPRQRVLRR